MVMATLWWSMARGGSDFSSGISSPAARRLGTKLSNRASTGTRRRITLPFLVRDAGPSPLYRRTAPGIGLDRVTEYNRSGWANDLSARGATCPLPGSIGKQSWAGEERSSPAQASAWIVPFPASTPGRIRTCVTALRRRVHFRYATGAKVVSSRSPRRPLPALFSSVAARDCRHFREFLTFLRGRIRFLRHPVDTRQRKRVVNNTTTRGDDKPARLSHRTPPAVLATPLPASLSYVRYYRPVSPSP